MIDYIKIRLFNIDVERLVNLQCLVFMREISEITGEYSNKRTAKYNFCTITVFDIGSVYFSGSIHKMRNEINGIKAPNHKTVKRYKGFNGNQFTIEDVLEARDHLTKLFDCTPEQMVFQNIEFGINTTPKFDPRKFLKGLLYHNNVLFEYRFKGNLAQVEHQRYIVKIYYKSKQYGMSNYVLRIEIKIMKSEELKKAGIVTFADINNETLDNASRLLLNRFDEVMHYDYTIKDNILSKTSKQSLNDYKRPRYWIDEVQPRHRDRHKKRLQEITKNHSYNLHHQLRQDIVEKCVIINRVIDTKNCVTNNTSNIELNITHLNKIKCPVTGLPLTYENNDAKYIKTATIKYLRLNDVNAYIGLCNLLLPNFNGDHPKFESDIISHLAKQVRNRYYNQFKIKRTGYNQKQYPNQMRLPI